MLKKIITFLSFSVLAASLCAAQTPDNYEPGPDSKPQAGVPKGEMIKFVFDKSKIFPGTTREVVVYVPMQYTPDKPACVYVGQDGLRADIPIVFDNLINKKEMPVTIGVFIPPGRVTTPNADTGQDRYNRSFEYDSLGDNYVRFLLEEILPEVETKKTGDGRPVKLSHSGNDRAIGGQSSGAIAAFTAAWERPSEFSRVFSAIGTYVGLRGGDVYPTLIRKYEPKPIRIFLQDGTNDLNNFGGDWWMANQTMERSLVFAGYEVNHVWGEGPHSGKHAVSIFPDIMRWLWKDWPQPVKNSPTKNATLADILIPGEDWQLVADGYKFTEGPATNAKGEIFFSDVTDSKTYKIGADGRISLFNADSKRGNGQAFGPDGKLYAVASGTQQVIAYDADGKSKVIADGIAGNDIIVAHNGNIYVTNPQQAGSTEPSKVWLIKRDGTKSVVDTGLVYSNGVTLSTDQTMLFVADYRSHWVYSYSIQPDGTLTNKQRFYWIHSPDNQDSAGSDGIRVDSEGRLYVATAMGIQIADQPGKVQCIIPTPNRRISNLTFGGPNLDTVYVTSGDRVYKRKLKVKGILTWDKPVKPPVPRL